MSSLREQLAQRLQRRWYATDKQPNLLLRPLSWIYRKAAQHQRKKHQTRAQRELSVPIVVVGNISVGGTGKSPLVAGLINILREQDYRPAILSRGYGGEGLTYPHLVSAEDSPAKVGDEALMLKLMLDCPVMVDPDRVRGAKQLIQSENPDLIICDDGLQHYGLYRDLEIAVIDGSRGLGNGQLLPAGPLREPFERLSEVDWVVCNGVASDLEPQLREMVVAEFYLCPRAWRQLGTGLSSDIAELPATEVHAVAGIGNPERFFQSLESLGMNIERHAKPDHFVYHRQDFPSDEKPVVMTAKDAVKCRAFAEDHWWALDVEAELPDQFRQEFLLRCEQLMCRSAE